jgi:diamine N-acetyltransferase
MHEAVIVRMPVPEEAEAVAALAHDIWHRHYPGIITVEQIDYMLTQRYAPGLIAEQISYHDHGWWIAELDGRLTGFAHASLANDYCKLDKLYIHPDRQHQGLGSAQLQQAVAWARQHGRHRLILQVNRHNALALAAYRKYGFSIVESRVCDIGGGFVMDDHFMEFKI